MKRKVILTSAAVFSMASMVMFSENTVSLLEEERMQSRVLEDLDTEAEGTEVDLAKYTKQKMDVVKGRNEELQKRISYLKDLLMGLEREIQERKEDAALRCLSGEFNLELENMANRIRQELVVLESGYHQLEAETIDLVHRVASEEKKRQAVSGGDSKGIVKLPRANPVVRKMKPKKKRKVSVLKKMPASDHEKALQKREQEVAKFSDQQAALESTAQSVEVQTVELRSQFESNKAKLDTIMEEKKKSKQGSTTVSTTPSLGKSFIANATAYSCQAASMGRYSCFGIDLFTQPRVIAVDPKVIPLGSRVEVEGLGVYIAGDTGSAIIGDHIDIHFPTYAESCAWGRQFVRVTVLD